MKYTHPKHYKGLKIDTSHNQNIVRSRVEEYCLKCDQFMGKEHDFSECQIYNQWKDGKIVKHKTCPFENMAVSVIDPQFECDVES